MERELKERLNISLNYFLCVGEEFTIDCLQQFVELSGVVNNLFLKVQDFVQEKIKGGLVADTGKTDEDGQVIYRKEGPQMGLFHEPVGPEKCLKGGFSVGLGNLWVAKILGGNGEG